MFGQHPQAKLNRVFVSRFRHFIKEGLDRESSVRRTTPQPNLVPVNPTSSRIAHNKGMSGSASIDCSMPFRLILNSMVSSN
jgi:hypothetical protein